MDNRTKDILILLLVFILAEVCVLFVVFKYYDDGGQCLQNPFVYGVDKLNKANDDNILCSCTLKDGTPFWINGSTLYFNKWLHQTYVKSEDEENCVWIGNMQLCGGLEFNWTNNS